MAKRKTTGRTYMLHTPAAYMRVRVAEAVEKLEADGWEVYWPSRDNGHEGIDGWEVNGENAAQMAQCDFVHIMWDGKASGLLFGLGMAFALQKSIKVIQVPDQTTWQSFQNLVHRWRSAKF